jgi:hypothetical protein
MYRLPGRSSWFVILCLCAGCDPVPDEKDLEPTEPQAPDCPEGTIADDQECVPEACGVGPWGDLPIDDGTVFVDVSAADGGDGSEGAPFSSLQAGADAAGAAGGGQVAIAAGSYAETVIVDGNHAGVALAGRCADLVTLDASVGGDGDAGLTIDTRAATLEVSSLTVQGSNYMGVFAVSGAVTLRDVRIADNAYAGLYVMSPFIGASTSLLAEDCEISENTAAGVHLDGSAVDVVLRRVVVRDSQWGGGGLVGVGIGVVGGAALLLEDSELSGNRAEGLLIRDGGTSVEVSRTLIHGTLSDSSGLYGYGIQASGGASLTVDGCEIAENSHSGVNVVETGTEAIIRDTLIRDTLPTEDGAHGSAIEVGAGASLTVESSELAGFRSFGVGITGEGTVATIDDTTLRDAVEGVAVPSGIGVVVLDQASASIDASTFTNVAGMGIAVLESGSAAVVSSTTVSGTRTVGPQGQYGIGMAAGIGASLEASDCELADNGTIGVLVANEGSVATLTDVLISDTRRGDAYTVGVAVAVVDGAELTGSRLTATGTQGPGLYAMSPGTRLVCTDCIVEAAQFAGIVAEQGAEVELSGCEIAHTEVGSNVGGGVGIWASAEAAEPTTLHVQDSTISDNPVGGVWLSGPGSYHLQRNELQGGPGEERGSLVRCGDAVYARAGVSAWDGELGLYLEGNTLRDGHGAGLFLDGATATLAGNTWDANTVDVVAQGSACAVPPDGLDTEPVASTELCPTWDYSTCADEFELYLELAMPEGT